MRNIIESEIITNGVTEDEAIAHALTVRGPYIIHNPELHGVDPWSQLLTREQECAVVHEAMINPMYFYQMVMQCSTWGKRNNGHNKHKED